MNNILSRKTNILNLVNDLKNNIDSHPLDAFLIDNVNHDIFRNL